jgi:hypothetical protein
MNKRKSAVAVALKTGMATDEEEGHGARFEAALLQNKKDGGRGGLRLTK